MKDWIKHIVSFILLAIFTGLSLNAQVFITRDTTIKYWVTKGNQVNALYEWNITPALPSFNPGTDTIQSVNWRNGDTAAIYTLEVTPKDTTYGVCDGDPKSINVKLYSDFTNLPVKVSWNIASDTICSPVTGSAVIIDSVYVYNYFGTFKLSYQVDTGEIVELPPSSVSPVSITIDKGLTAGRDHHVRITKIVTATISNPSVIQTYSNEIVLKINMKPIPAIGEISSDDIVTTQQSRLQSVCANGIPKLYSISGGLGMTYYWNTDIKNSVFTNKYGTPSIDTLKDSIYVSWPKTAADHYLIVFGETAGCVTPSKSLAIHVNNLPVVSLEGDVNLCQGQETTFTIHGDFKSIRWANQAIDSTYTTNKNDTVVVVVTDPKNCIGTDTAIVKVIPLPVVYLGKDTMLCGEHTLLLDAGNSGAKYLWSTGENNQTITIGKLAGGKLISVKVTVNDQPYNIECSNSDSIRIITCNILFTKDSIPTAFTPNGDGENDTWRIPGIADHAKAVVEVYDRWGRIVFHSLPGYIKEWNGRDDGGNFVPMDNYYYIINLNEKNAAPVVGSITIIR